MDKVLSVRNLTKKIGGRTIVDGVSFDVHAGEIFGFLGPNGSGKTTTIRMLVDLIKPTAGEVSVCGYSVHRSPEKALSLIGCIVENPEVYNYMTGWENLEHFARMLPGVGPGRMAEVTELVRLTGSIHDKVRTYSLGMRQRLGIAQALLNRPRLLILDEPTNGLDPQGIHELRDFVRKLAGEGVSLFISSHMLNEIQLMCDRYAIIHGGRIRAVGSMESFAGRETGIVLWELDQRDKGKAVLAKDPAIRLLDGPPGQAAGRSAPASFGDAAIAAVMDFSRIPAAVEKLVYAQIGVLSVRPAAQTLENLFLETTSETV